MWVCALSGAALLQEGLPELYSLMSAICNESWCGVTPACSISLLFRLDHAKLLTTAFTAVSGHTETTARHAWQLECHWCVVHLPM